MFTLILRSLQRFGTAKKQRSLYEVLKIPRSANLQQVKASYYKLAKQYHPDAHQGSSSIAEIFKQINQAYNILKDPQRRKEYDRQNFTTEGDKKQYKFYDTQHTYGYGQTNYRKNPYHNANPFQSTFSSQKTYRESGANPYNSDFSGFYKPSSNQSGPSKQPSPENWQEYVRQQHRKNVAENRKLGMNRLKQSNAIMLIILGVVSVYIIGELTFKIYEFNNFYRARTYAEKLDPGELQEYEQRMRLGAPRKDYY